MREDMKIGVNVRKVSLILCKEFSMKEEFLVNHRDHKQLVMTLDIGALVSLARIIWLSQYLNKSKQSIEERVI